MLKPKILVLYDRNGCCYWRSWLPFQKAQKEALATVKFLELRFTTKTILAEHFKWADIVHMVGLMDASGAAMMKQCQNLGLKVAVDYDDLHFNCSPFNPKYKHFGTEEVEVIDPETKEKKMLWKDGQEGFDIKRNKIKFHSYRMILQEADLITTTTHYLKQAFSDISGREDNIRVIPNAIDFDQWKPLDVREKFKDTFRFGWAVSGSHGEDWIYIKSAINEFLSRHKDAKFVVLGDTYMDIRKGFPEGQVEWYPFSDLWEGHYQLRMPLLSLDAAIAPLAETEFNKCKSPLKYAEYTAFGWPVIAQKMTPYLEHIMHGETGLLANDKTSWVTCLEALYSNKELRRKLHFNALFTCKELFDLNKVCREWVDVYKETINGVTTNV